MAALVCQSLPAYTCHIHASSLFGIDRMFSEFNGKRIQQSSRGAEIEGNIPGVIIFPLPYTLFTTHF